MGGHTITVAPDIYTENVIINKSVILIGANSGLPGCDGGRTAESTVDGGAGIAFTILADNVTIDGFEILGLQGVSVDGFYWI